MPPKRSTRKVSAQEPTDTVEDQQETNVEENEDMDNGSDDDLGFESALEDFSGESDYYQPSDDEEEDEEENEIDQDFQDMVLEKTDSTAFDKDEEINERQFEYVLLSSYRVRSNWVILSHSFLFTRQIMAAATTDDSSIANSNLESLWDIAEEDMEEFEHDLAMTTGIGRAKRRKGKSRRGPREHPLTPEIKAMLGEANQHYVNREYAEAIQLYQEIVRQDSKVHSAWVNLGMIQEELGNPERALLLKMVAAHLKPKDIDTWKSLAVASM
jgi:general transcription factor 3C polypeptide 3 (transcription factor C subunit 4)